MEKVDVSDLKFVESCYNDFNEQYFSGELPPVKFGVANNKNYISCIYRKVDMPNHRLVPTRLVFSTAHPLTPEAFRNAMVHEMIHISACLQPLSGIPLDTWRKAEKIEDADEREELLGLTQEGDHGAYFTLMKNMLNANFEELDIEEEAEEKLK